MTFHAGPVPAGTSLYIPFSTYAGSTGASATCSGLAVTDIEIYKNGSTTQRASDAGIALLDTDGIDFDGITGLHGFSIDLSDNTDSGFFAVGSWYWVVVSAITVDSQTVTFLAATFRIAPAESLTGYPVTDVGGISGDSAAADNLEAACDNYSATRGLAGTALPNAAADAAGGLPISDAGGLDLDSKLANTNEVTAVRMGALTDWIDGGRLDLILDIIAADTTTDIPALIAALQTYVDTEVAAIKAKTDNLPSDPADQSAVEAAITSATSGLATAANLATVAGYLDTEIAAILADTNELQTDWANGGRLDLILDARASQTSVDDIPTSTELAAALLVGVNVTEVDGSTLNAHGIGMFPADVRDWNGLGATIAVDAENNAPSVAVSHVHEDAIAAASVSAAAVTKIQNGLASQTSVDDLPTNSELAIALAAADDAVLAAINALENLSAAEVNAEMLDVLNVDTFGELAAPPAASSTLRDKLTWIFMCHRNLRTETATQRKLYADNGSSLVGTEAVSDDGTTFTKGEVA